MTTNNAPAWVGITYLIYCTVVLVLCLGGTGYAVFVLGHSGWWILAGLVIASGGFRPARWHQVWTGVDKKVEDDA